MNKKNQTILESALSNDAFLTHAKKSGYSTEQIMDEISNMTDVEMLYRSCLLISDITMELIDKNQGLLKSLYEGVEEIKTVTKEIVPIVSDYIKISNEQIDNGEDNAPSLEEVNDISESLWKLERLALDVDDPNCPEDLKGQSYLQVLFSMIIERVIDIKQATASSMLYRESSSDPEALKTFINKISKNGVLGKSAKKRKEN